MHAWHMRCAKGWQLGQHFRAHVRLHCCMQCSGGGAAEGTLLPAAARTFLAELVQGRPEHSVKQGVPGGRGSASRQPGWPSQRRRMWNAPLARSGSAGTSCLALLVLERSRRPAHCHAPMAVRRAPSPAAAAGEGLGAEPRSGDEAPSSWRRMAIADAC